LPKDPRSGPIGAILDWTMGTPAGFPAYRDLRINAALKEILDAWAAFLDRPDSLYVFNESPTGWKCAQARRAVVQNRAG
jgi:phosphatidylserine decarboxylase